MKLSARNILKGKVVKIVKGAVNSEITLELPGGVQIISIITNTSIQNLKLKKGRGSVCGGQGFQRHDRSGLDTVYP